MKKPQTLIAAKIAEVAAAKELLARLESEQKAAYADVRQAQHDADFSRDQCMVVRVQRGWGAHKEDEMFRAVILRKTPGGMMVVREAGRTDGSEYKFKWCPHRSVYMEVEKGKYASILTNELREVPAAYLPMAPEPPKKRKP